VKRRIKASNKYLLFVQGFVALNVVWYLLSLTLQTRAFPSPAAVYLHLDKILSDRLYLHLLASLGRASCGLVLSLAAGIAVGLVMARSKAWNRILNPLLYFAYPVPKTALLPVIMLLLGLGEASKIGIIVLIVVFQVIVTTRGAVLGIPRETYGYIRSLGASGVQAFFHVTLPAILPELLTNVKVSAGTALSILFFAETYGTHWGLGWYIMDSWSRIDYPGMYLGILSISLLGFAFFAGVDVLEEKFCSWRNMSN
jgi:NitT/TauT family transport system permease protein